MTNNSVECNDKYSFSDNELKSNQTNHTEDDPEIAEIISDRLPFVVRWGALIFGLIIILLIIFCWIIKYPDTIITTGTLSSINSPRSVVVKEGGKLVKINVKENEFISKGAIVGYMESAADPSTINHISRHLNTIENLIIKHNEKDIKNIISSLQSKYFSNNLGEVQPAYQEFIEAFTQYKDVLNDGFLVNKQSILLNDLRNINQLHTILLEQRNLLEQDLSLSAETAEANKVLVENKVIAALDYRIEQSKLLAKRLTLPQINIAIVNNRSALNSKNQELIELRNRIITQKQLFEQSLRTFKSNIQKWELKYILKAPVSGNIFFTGFFQENQEIKTGETLFLIQPTNSLYYVEITIPQYNFGKIELGQPVALKFKAYPYEQYGSVIGILTYVSKIPVKDGYLAKVSLPKELLTNRNKKIHYQQGLEVEAEIVTTNTRLLNRIYNDSFRKLSQANDI